MRELKPCPFCGQKISVYSMDIDGGRPFYLQIECPNCSTEFNIHASCMYGTESGETAVCYPYGDAIDVWNRRWCENAERKQK